MNKIDQSEITTQNEIIKKKAQNSLSDLKNLHWGEFFKKIGYFTIQLIIVFIIGSRILVACKYAQANLLPTNENCKPYTDIDPIFDQKEPKINIDKMNIFENGSTTSYATTIIFPFKESILNNFFIDKLKNQSEKYNVSGLKMYLIEVLKTIFCWNFTILNGLLNLINNLPFETLIILLGPFILKYYLVFGYIISIIIAIIAFIFNISWLFKKNENNSSGVENVDPKSPPQWENIHMTEDLFEFFGVIFNLIGGWLLCLFVTIIPLHFIIFIICFITPFWNSNPDIILEPNDPDSKTKKYTFLQSIRGIFETKLDIFMIIICFNIIYTAHSYINSTATIFATIACIAFIYWSYKKPKTIPSYSSTFVGIDVMNGKTCSNISESIFIK